MKKSLIVAILAILSASCKNNGIESDASGTFEAIETIISAEAGGVVKQLKAEEGSELKAGEMVGYIDSLQLVLKRKQIESQIKAVISRNPDKASQLAVLEEQLKQARHEKIRIENLVNGGAATVKQQDDINTQVTILSSQLNALKSSLNITSSSISEESVPLKVQIEQLNDQISRCRIINPVEGTVLSQYTRENEMAAIGKPLYKIADLSNITLKAYITGSQLPQIKLNQEVRVLIDQDEDQVKEYKGIIEWISDKSEFTPKTIQTKDERANLVYAIKIRVKNDGYLKIGMYGEVLFK